MQWRKQAYQAQVVVAMQVADENVIDPLGFNAISEQLQLGSFAAVDQKKTFIRI